MGASTQKKGCAFCGALAATDGGPLAPCKNCKVAAYCGEEHQNYDWKRHKIFCKAIQSKNAAALQNRQLRDSHSESSGASTSSLNSSQLSTSCSSSSSSSSTSSKSLSLQALSLSLAGHSGSPNNSIIGLHRAYKSSSRNKITCTGDPDIQIIESSSPRLNRAVRKRPQQPLRQIKDHMLNRPYSVDIIEHISLLLKNSTASTLYDALALRVKHIADHVINQLNEYGWAIVDSFFGLTHCRQALAEMETLYEHGLFSPGQLLVKRSIVQAQDVRTDEIFWFDAEDERLANASSLRLLVSTIDSVAEHFKDRLCSYNICSRAKPMIALYPGNGARYVKHVDNPAGDGRCVTSIYYCNENWDTEKNGGAFRIYPKTSATPITINPKADRLLFFFSGRQNPHEVLPTFRKRFAMTIWYYDRNERDELESRRLSKSQHVSCTAVLPSGSCGVQKVESLQHDPVEISEPPTKWKAERWIPTEGSGGHNQMSRISEAFLLLHNSGQLCNRKPNDERSLQYRSTFGLPFQTLGREPKSLEAVVRPNLNGLENRSGLILGCAPSVFLNARSNVI